MDRSEHFTHQDRQNRSVLDPIRQQTMTHSERGDRLQQPNTFNAEQIAEDYINAVRTKISIRGISLTEEEFDSTKKILLEKKRRGEINDKIYDIICKRLKRTTEKSREISKQYDESKKGIERYERYRKSDKGQIVRKQYDMSMEGKEVYKRYRLSEKRKKVQKRYDMSKRGMETRKRCIDKLKQNKEKINILHIEAQKYIDQCNIAIKCLEQKIEFQRDVAEIKQLNKQIEIIQKERNDLLRYKDFSYQELEKVQSLVTLYGQLFDLSSNNTDQDSMHLDTIYLQFQDLLETQMPKRFDKHLSEPQEPAQASHHSSTFEMLTTQYREFDEELESLVESFRHPFGNDHFDV
jgi:hypothetical protein